MINDKIIVALDTQDIEQFNFLIDELSEEATFVKVGMELFYTLGPDIIRRLKDQDFKVFLDLKLHDIPNTVEKATRTLAGLGVDILNVHAAGGLDMMKAANNGASLNSHMKMIAVTQLTSTDENILKNEILIENTLEDTVLKYAALAKEAELSGIVCSAHEVEMIKENITQNFICVTPGIRPSGSQVHDQKRVMTPKEAITSGSDHLVIGRSITQAKSPRLAYQEIMKELS